MSADKFGGARELWILLQVHTAFPSLTPALLPRVGSSAESTRQKTAVNWRKVSSGAGARGLGPRVPLRCAHITRGKLRGTQKRWVPGWTQPFENPARKCQRTTSGRVVKVGGSLNPSTFIQIAGKKRRVLAEERDPAPFANSAVMGRKELSASG